MENLGWIPDSGSGSWIQLSTNINLYGIQSSLLLSQMPALCVSILKGLSSSTLTCEFPAKIYFIHLSKFVPNFKMLTLSKLHIVYSQMNYDDFLIAWLSGFNIQIFKRNNHRHTNKWTTWENIFKNRWKNKTEWFHSLTQIVLKNSKDSGCTILLPPQ